MLKTLVIADHKLIPRYIDVLGQLLVDNITNDNQFMSLWSAITSVLSNKSNSVFVSVTRRNSSLRCGTRKHCYFSH